MATQYVIRSPEGYLSTAGAWDELVPGYRIRLFPTEEEAEAAKPEGQEEVEVVKDPRLPMPDGPYNVLVRTGFMGKSGLVPLQNNEALQFADVESALSAAQTAGFDLSKVRVVPYRMNFAR